MAKKLLCGNLIPVVTIILIVYSPLFVEAKAPYYQDNPFGGAHVFFQKGCANCHSILNVGGKVGPDLGKVELNYSFFGIASIMWNHAPKMLGKLVDIDVSFPKLSYKEMESLITFLSYLNYLERPGDPVRGKLLFTEKVCIKCHSVGEVDGFGGSVGPELDKFYPYRSPIFLTTAFWNKAPEMAETMLELNVKWPEFYDNEIIDIMAFIRENASVKSGKYQRVYVPPGDPKVGKSLLKEKRCTHCHGIHGEGGDIGPDLGNPGLRISFTEIAGRMWNHGPKMWQAMSEEGIPIPKFSETEMSDISSYLYFAAIQEKDGNTLNGERLIKEKGCNNCHPIGRKYGDPDLAPDLVEKSTKLKLDSPTKVFTEMWNHIQSMSNRVEEMGMTWPTIDLHEMADITAYIVRLAKP